jgi:transcriptional regulator with XRE-family HTH domain
LPKGQVQVKKLSEQVRQAILKAGVSRYRIAKETGVDQPALSRFVHGERGLSIEALDAIGLYLGLSITTSRPRRPAKKKEK